MAALREEIRAERPVDDASLNSANQIGDAGDAMNTVQPDRTQQHVINDQPARANGGQRDALGDAGDAMDVVEPDRVVNPTNTDYNYIVNTDIGVGANSSNFYGMGALYANRYNDKTGRVEDLRDGEGQYIDNTSGKNDRNRWLNKKYEPKTPIVKDDSDPAPSLDELVTVGTGQVARSVEGTPENPNVVNKALPNCLFIDGKADQNDVRQGNVGDCYFLAGVLGIIHNDPNFFPRIMESRGDEVYVYLYHQEWVDTDKEEHAYRDPKHWVRKPIAVKWGETMRARSGSNYYEHIGSYYRVKYEPESEVKWTASFEDDTLKISKNRYFQTAMWVNVLERAYADYASMYGVWGVNRTASASYCEATERNDRYFNITGGSPEMNAHMFFGDAVTNESEFGKIANNVRNETDETSLVDAAGKMFDDLVRLSQYQDGSQDGQMIMGIAGGYQAAYVPRVKFYANRLKNSVQELIGQSAGGAGAEALATAVSDLGEIVQDMELWQASSGPENKTKRDDAVARAKDAIERLSYNESFRALELPDWKALCAASGVMISEESRRHYDHIYIMQNHEYNIREVHFVDKEGNPIDINTLYAYYVDGVLDENYDPNAQNEVEPEPEEVEEKLTFWQKLFGKRGKKKKEEKPQEPQQPKVEPNVEFKLNKEKLKEIVDLDKSYVVIINPHARSKAHYFGQEEDRAGSGAWTTSLRELFVGTDTCQVIILRGGDNSATGTADVTASDGIGGVNAEFN